MHRSLPFRLTLLPALVLALTLAACGGEAEAPQTQATPPEATQTDEVAVAQMEDGVQVVEIEAGRMGYVPSSIELQAGVPARLIFTRTVEAECSEQVQVPAFGVPVTDLPLNERVAIEFTPDAAGTFEFICGMDMQHGSILVRS